MERSPPAICQVARQYGEEDEQKGQREEDGRDEKQPADEVADHGVFVGQPRLSGAVLTGEEGRAPPTISPKLRGLGLARSLPSR